jgi:lipoprotein-anchoring transpeptidase ErfK/SrfK
MKSVLFGVGALLMPLLVPAAQAAEKLAAVTNSETSTDAAVATVDSSVAKAAPAVGDTLSLALAVAKDMSRPPPPPPITLVLKVDLSNQRVTVVERGKVKQTWTISSGREGYATQTGTFQPTWTAKMWYSRQWDMAPMPNAVFFNGGTAFHATNAVGSLGNPASHGCIRLAPGNAAALYGLVQRHGLTSTKVVVQGRPRGEPAVARRYDRQGYQQAYADDDYPYRGRSQRGYRSGPGSWGF